MVSLLVAQVNLAFQAAIFALLVSALILARIRRAKYHAQVALAAVVLNVVSFIAVMAPSMGLTTAPTNVGSAFALAHGLVGASSSLLSLWVVGVWLMRPLIAMPARLECYGSLNKKLMQTAVSLWFVSLILGFILFIILRGKLL